MSPYCVACDLRSLGIRTQSVKQILPLYLIKLGRSFITLVFIKKYIPTYKNIKFLEILSESCYCYYRSELILILKKNNCAIRKLGGFNFQDVNREKITEAVQRLIKYYLIMCVLSSLIYTKLRIIG